MEALKRLSIQKVAEIVSSLKAKGFTLEEIEEIMFY